MQSKKYKFGNSVIEILPPEEIADVEPYSCFLCDDKPDFTVKYEYVERLPEITEGAVTDKEISFVTDGNKSICWYERNSKDGCYACRIFDGENYKVQLLERYRGRLWDGAIFNVLGFEELVAKCNSAVLHASVVLKSGKMILFTAPCGTGKSTQADLWEKYADAEIVGGMSVHDTTDKSDKNIRVTVEKVNKVLGIEIPEETIVSILEDLGFGVSANNGVIDVVVPTRRLDVNIPEDLIEEVGRIYGMDNIKGKLPELNVVTGSYDKTKREIKNKMVAMGLNETCSYTLIPKEEVHKFTTDSFEEIYLADPMSEDRNTLRYSLLYSLKEIYLYNGYKKDIKIEDQTNVKRETNSIDNCLERTTKGCIRCDDGYYMKQYQSLDFFIANQNPFEIKL